MVSSVLTFLLLVLVIVLGYIFMRDSVSGFLNLFKGPAAVAPNLNMNANANVAIPMANSTTPAGTSTALGPATANTWKCIQSSVAAANNWVKVKKNGSTVLCAGPDGRCEWYKDKDTCDNGMSTDGLICTQMTAGWCAEAAANL